jgi:hypothetical protein
MKRDEAMWEVSRLLRQSMDILYAGHMPEALVWRLVDAAGLVAGALENHQRAGLIGLAVPTGRGFRLLAGGKPYAAPSQAGAGGADGEHV